ncbi:MAG TPA: hypothetical protein DFR83_02205, partial [Deltaproteobacteria bacterium]|nr:hypothetical protein [Deltaproteobacteria bacterium]
MDSLKTLLSTEHLQRRYHDWKLEAGDEEPTLIALFGQWNAGKSSLVNALLDSPELVPTGPTPETGLPVVISGGSRASAVMEIGETKHPIFNRTELQKAIHRGGDGHVIHLT